MNITKTVEKRWQHLLVNACKCIVYAMRQRVYKYVIFRSDSEPALTELVELRLESWPTMFQRKVGEDGAAMENASTSDKGQIGHTHSTNL